MKRITIFQKALYALVLMVPAGNAAWGQIVVNESFEQSCSNAFNAFYLNCITGWTSASGTPDNAGSFGAAYDGGKYAHLYANYNGVGMGCNNPEGSEGILLNYNFQAGITYKITYYTKGGAGVNPASQTYTANWILTNGIANQTGAPCTTGDQTPPIPAGNQTVGSPVLNNSVWSFNQHTFTPSSNFSQLWFRHYITSTVWNSTASVSMLIDKVTIEKICAITPTISGATAFCNGSPITLNGGYTPSDGCSVTKHVWTVIETDQYGTVVPGATEWWSPWYLGAPGQFTIPSDGPLMTCGKYYRVNLAVQNAFTPWAAISRFIHIDCPPAFGMNGSTTTICSGDPAGLTVNMGHGSNSTYNMTVTPVSPAGPTVYDGPLAAVQVYPTVTTDYNVTVTDITTGCATTTQIRVAVLNNDPSFNLNVNTTDPNYFTLDLQANNLNGFMNTGFYYQLMIEELDSGSNPYYQEIGTDCWWNYPGTETFQGYVSTGTGSYNQGPWGSCPQPTGQFLYNHTYRITRMVGNSQCPQQQFSMIITPVNSANRMLVYEDKHAPDYTKTISRTDGKHLEDAVTISPNPGTGWYTISIPGSEAQIAIYNLFGEEVTHFESRGTTAKFDLTGFPKGIYLVKIQSGTEQTTKKVVLE